MGFSSSGVASVAVLLVHFQLLLLVQLLLLLFVLLVRLGGGLAVGQLAAQQAGERGAVVFALELCVDERVVLEATFFGNFNPDS